jgi:hypothetical protein
MTAGGSVALRKMKKLHEYVVSWYLNTSMMVTSLIFIFILQQPWSVFGKMDYRGWLLIISAGVFVNA